MRTGQRGSTSVELAIVTPALIALVIGILQFGLWYHAEVVTRAAAMEAARMAAVEDGSTGAARDRAEEVMADGVGRIAGEPGISFSIGAETVYARVHAELRPIIPLPGLRSFDLSATAIAYRERFRHAD